MATTTTTTTANSNSVVANTTPNTTPSGILASTGSPQPITITTASISSQRGNTIVIDNGASSLRIGFSGDADPIKCMPNYISTAKNPKNKFLRKSGDMDRTIFVGDEIETDCTDPSAFVLRRPLEKGYLVDCDAQQEVWTYALGGKDNLNVNIDHLEDKRLVVSTASFPPTTLANDMDQLVFEYFGFGQYAAVSSPYLSLLSYQAEDPTSSVSKLRAGIVVDSGFSFTTITPFLNNKAISAAVKRVHVGGELLTNYLKELVSFRAYDMKDETVLINRIKECLCFVSLDFDTDMEITRRAYCNTNDDDDDKNNNNRGHTIKREYVLPDGIADTLGHVKDPNEPSSSNNSNKDEQLLTMNSERFTVPEVLFNPSDIGLEQAGIPEAIVQSVSSIRDQDIQQALADLPPLAATSGNGEYHSPAAMMMMIPRSTCDALRGMLYENIIITGGNTRIPQFQQRLEMEVRQMVSTDFNVVVNQPKDALLSVWRGGSVFGANETLMSQVVVTKQQYDEYGHSICRRRFVL